MTTTREPGAATVFTAARIEALDGTTPEAFAVEGQWITATGSRVDLAGRFSGSDWVDLDGAMVVPGLNDAHCHTSQAALGRVRVDASAMTTPAALEAALVERARRTSAGEWVVGQGLDDARVAVDRDLLDRVSTVHPVVVVQYTFHRAVANSLALQRIGYAVPEDAPYGGQLPTDGAGRINGWMYERAWLDSWLPGRTGQTIAPPGGDLHSQVAALEEVNAELNAVGITSYCDAIVTPVEQQMYAVARDQGALTARVGMLLWHSWFRAEDWHAPVDEDHRLSLAGVKLMLDGALSGGTCLCRQPYPSATGGDNGLQILDDETFERTVRAVHGAGARVAVHANGDRAISHVLDVFASLSTDAVGRRRDHRIEHCSLVDDEIIGRLRALGVTPVPFGAFVSLFGEALEGFYSAERAAFACAHRSMLDAGLPVAGSSDYPIVSVNPFIAIQSMVTRATASGRVVGPDQRLDVMRALGVYTHGSAHATGESAFKGRLTAGQLADFAVLDRDLWSMAPDEIAGTRVRSTWVGGECVWQSS